MTRGEACTGLGRLVAGFGLCNQLHGVHGRGLLHRDMTRPCAGQNMAAWLHSGRVLGRLCPRARGYVEESSIRTGWHRAHRHARRRRLDVWS